MKLYGTVASHFTRKVRVVLHELGLPYEFVVIKDLTDLRASTFAGNDLLQIPILEDGPRRLIESDIICAYLLSQGGKSEAEIAFLPRGGDHFGHLQPLALINGGMAAGAHLMGGRRSEIPDLEKYPYFQQQRSAMLGALNWLDHDLEGRARYQEGTGLSMLEIALVCFADWAVFREMVPSLAEYPHVEAFVAHWRDRPSFQVSHPSVAV